MDTITPAQAVTGIQPQRDFETDYLITLLQPREGGHVEQHYVALTAESVSNRVTLHRLALAKWGECGALDYEFLMAQVLYSRTQVAAGKDRVELVVTQETLRTYMSKVSG